MKMLIVAAVLVLLMARPAYAYLDPGTGSMLVQGLLAGVALASAAVAAFWTRIVQLFKGRGQTNRSAEGDDQEPRLP